jgi:hypothetical protein
MVVANALTPPVKPASDAPGQDRCDERLAVLRELREIGMVLARGVKREALALEAAAEAEAPPAEAAAPARSASELSLDFARVSRATQRGLALEARFEAERESGAKARADAAAEHAAAQEQARLERKRLAVKDIVKRGIAADIAGSDDDDLSHNFWHSHAKYLRGKCERWLKQEEDEDLDALPVGEIVGLVCEDLGIAFDPELWREAPATAHAADRAPSSCAGWSRVSTSASGAQSGVGGRDGPGQDDEEGERQSEPVTMNGKGARGAVPPRPP